MVTCFYNAERFLGESIESVLGQTFEDFEYLLVNDSSTDGSRQIAESYLRDPRVHLIDTERNIGTYPAANLALARSRGEYIARLDADDLSLPHRLAAQVEFLDRHPDVGLLRTGFQCVDEGGNPVDPPQQNRRPCWELRWILLFWNCIPHSTVMFRRDVARQLGYYALRRYTQDYDLWSRMSFVTEIAEIEDVCVRYRLTHGGLSATQFPAQRSASEEVNLRALGRLLGRHDNDPPLKKFVQMLYRINDCSPHQLKELERFILSVVDPFCELFGYDGKIRNRIVAKVHEHMFSMMHFAENEAPLRSLLIYLHLIASSGHPQSWSRLLPAFGKLVLGRRGTRLAFDVQRRVRALF